ncbi:unnamed protein product [Adineta steineri]|uniref:Enoyl reductase (ER) domain-containing protein n=1 Tax=Adineta steineri TaxID=433720 RepID=A0A813SEP4_9BILA|nr:unnamed protein product [Adineta steineri]CAF0803081.1 unnamed protein product [Adineta steineri]CAF3774070.1 unnamed protein product [Adineta steineri]CAF3774264.1 unnamed protein product [Adineta steineri]
MTTMDHSQMMKQWQFTKSGSPRDVLTMAEVPVPTTCADDEVLVQVSHVSLNSAIAYRLIAHYGVVDPVGAFIGRPAVPEMDFSGVVCDLRGANVTEFNTGDRVFGLGPTSIRYITQGVLREYVLAKRNNIVKIPDSISLKDAACFPATSFTAYCFLVEKANLKEGQKVFINGGSGGVGVMAIQLARTIVGPTGLVVATCSPAKSDIVRNLGADEIIDYTSHNLPDFLREHYSSRPFDVILDTVGSDHALYSNSPDYLTPSGLFCTIGIVEFGSTIWLATKRILQLLSAMVVPVYLGGVSRRHIFEPLTPNHPRLVAMAKLVEEGAMKAVIDSTYKFIDARDAYDRMMSRKVTGKVVIEVNDLEKLT